MIKKTLVVGASGSTGKHVVNELLSLEKSIKIIVRPTSKIPDHWNKHHKVEIIHKNISDISLTEMSTIMTDCDSAISCLGHNLSIKGIYGKPRKLVVNAMKLICNAAIKNNTKLKVVLMNTAGNYIKKTDPKISIGQKILLSIIRTLLPPHPDNEKAAKYLMFDLGNNHQIINWIIVRPDGLINEEKVTAYQVYNSPIRSAIFNAGKTSRINVGSFMAHLTVDTELWNKWKGKAPVIYNTEFNK